MVMVSKAAAKTFSLHWGSGIIAERDIGPLKKALAEAPKLRKLLARLVH